MDGDFISYRSFRRKSWENNKNKWRAIIAYRRCVWREQINFNKFLSYYPPRSQRPFFLIPKRVYSRNTVNFLKSHHRCSESCFTTPSHSRPGDFLYQYTHPIQFVYASHLLVVWNGFMSYFHYNSRTHIHTHTFLYIFRVFFFLENREIWNNCQESI